MIKGRSRSSMSSALDFFGTALPGVAHAIILRLFLSLFAVSFCTLARAASTFLGSVTGERRIRRIRTLALEVDFAEARMWTVPSIGLPGGLSAFCWFSGFSGISKSKIAWASILVYSQKPNGSAVQCLRRSCSPPVQAGLGQCCRYLV